MRPCFLISIALAAWVPASRGEAAERAAPVSETAARSLAVVRQMDVFLKQPDAVGLS